MKFFKKKRGFSLAEIMISLGLMGAFGFIILDYMAIVQKNTKKDSEDFKVDYTVRIMQQLLYSKEKCDIIITNSDGTLDPSSLNFENLTEKAHHYKEGMNIADNISLDKIQANFSGDVGRSVVKVDLEFNKGLQKKWTKQIAFQVSKNSTDNKVSCLSYDKDLINNSAIEKFCLMASGVADPACTLSNLSDNFRKRLSELICEMINQNGSIELSNEKCKTIDLNGHIFARNIDDKKVCANTNSGECREIFQNESCPGGQFLKGINTRGEIVCGSLGQSCNSPTYGPCNCSTMLRDKTIICTGQQPQITQVACDTNNNCSNTCDFQGQVDAYVENILKNQITINYDSGSPALIGQAPNTYKAAADLRMKLLDSMSIVHRCYFGFKTTPEEPSQLTKGFFGKTQNYPDGIKWTYLDGNGQKDTSKNISGNPNIFDDKIWLSTTPFGSLDILEMTGGALCEFDAKDLYPIICPSGTDNPQSDPRSFEKLLTKLTKGGTAQNPCNLVAQQWYGSDDGLGMSILCSSMSPGTQIQHDETYSYRDDDIGSSRLGTYVVKCNNGTLTKVSSTCPYDMIWKYNGNSPCVNVTTSAYPHLGNCAEGNSCQEGVDDKCRADACTGNIGNTNTYQCLPKKK
ncbi:MAG: hypothetical protein H6622_02815 [Halobacteriovoraceae bacterium]|nr:hypothetical protein [Halobacteriovoraceae bacterium]